jgi:ketosteroid isomerase-like protein
VLVSAENIEVVRRIYEAWKRRESVRSYLAEDVEYVNPSYAVESGTRRGPKSFAAVRDTYEDFDLRPVRFIDAEDDQVVVLAYYQGTGRASGVPVSGEHGHVWRIRGGVAVRFEWFQSHREALRAAGLAEDLDPDH